MRLYLLGLIVGVGLMGRAMVATNAVAQSPTADEIVKRMLEKNQERLEALESYESERTYRVDYKGTGGHHEAEMRVWVEYTAPEQKHMTILSESGSKFLCQKVLHKAVESEQEATGNANRMQMRLSPENYTSELEGEEVLDGVRAWVLKVVPKVDSKFTYRGRVWVSQDDYAVMRIVGEPGKNPSWWINHASFDSRYMRRGDVWVPQKNVSTSHVRLGGEATMTIDYGEYPVLAARPLKRDSDAVAAVR